MTASIPLPPRRGGFTFKQFFVGHDRCGMKVSTDGVLLGAWAPLPAARRILDIGTGSGLLSLMLAQRLSTQSAPFDIHAVDIDASAVEQAQENSEASPWRESLTIWQQDFLTWNAPSANKYGLVICNPPYFQHGKQYRDVQREKARDSSHLDYQRLLQKVATLLTDEGNFSLILPVQEAEGFVALAKGQGWILSQECAICERDETPVKRLMLTWCRHPSSLKRQRLVIRDREGNYSAAYQSLTRDFYLGF